MKCNMKPRNKRERLVVELSSKLPAITEAQIQWENMVNWFLKFFRLIHGWETP